MFLKLFKMFNDCKNYNLLKVKLSFYNKANSKPTEYFYLDIIHVGSCLSHISSA